MGTRRTPWKAGRRAFLAELRFCDEKRAIEPGLAFLKALVLPGKEMETRGPETGRVRDFMWTLLPLA